MSREALLVAFLMVALAWALSRQGSPGSKRGGATPADRAKPAPNDLLNALRGMVVLAYSVLFVWQFMVGKAIGRELGFMGYLLVAAVPTFLAGAPWSWILLEVTPADSQLDLTVLSARTLTYHARVFLSFAINVALIFAFLAWSERTATRSARE